MTETFAVRVLNLTKKYNGFCAVNQVNFEVPGGTIFGFLGPNGAGKTTTIKMLCTLLRPTEGQAFVADYNVMQQPMRVRQSIGIVFQEPTLDDRLTAYENLQFHGILYGLRGIRLRVKIQEMLELVELADKAYQRVKTFSGGMKRRLELARGLMHTPKILFLDEPTLGLDPQTRLRIWDYLRLLRKQGGITLFLTTHYLEEAENCDQIAIIDHGRIIAFGTPSQLKSKVQGEVVFLDTEDNPKAVDFLKSRYRLEPVEEERGIRVEVAQPEKFLPNFLREIPVAVTELSLHRPTLEDVFIHLTGSDLRDQEGSWLESARNIVRRQTRQ